MRESIRNALLTRSTTSQKEFQLVYCSRELFPATYNGCVAKMSATFFILKTGIYGILFTVMSNALAITLSLLIPLAGTTLGSAMVFFLKK